jgi:putative effector of murein hydrolase
VLLISGIFASGLIMAFNYMGKIEFTPAIIWAVSVLVAVESLAIVFKILSQKYEEYSHDNAYLVQNLKKDKDLAYEAYKTAKDKVNRIISETIVYILFFIINQKNAILIYQLRFANRFKRAFT